jgi:2-methylisocitrate lyase-like PEP mutase family enzyme
VAEAAALGVRRISVGGALARAAWGGFLKAARRLADAGRFDGLEGGAAGKELNAFFAARRG